MDTKSVRLLILKKDIMEEIFYFFGRSYMNSLESILQKFYTWDESATDAKAVNAPSCTICFPFWIQRILY